MFHPLPGAYGGIEGPRGPGAKTRVGPGIDGRSGRFVRNAPQKIRKDHRIMFSHPSLAFSYGTELLRRVQSLTSRRAWRRSPALVPSVSRTLPVGGDQRVWREGEATAATPCVCRHRDISCFENGIFCSGTTNKSGPKPKLKLQTRSVVSTWKKGSGPR